MSVFALALLAASGTVIPESLASSAVVNYKLVRPGLATAGQPSEETLRKLKELGFRTVVNLRTENERGAVAEERRLVEEAGLRYVHVPISPATFSRADVEAVGRVLDDPAAGPVLLHCASAVRVGAVWTVLEVGKGKAYADAEAEGRAIGLKDGPMVDAVRRLLDTASAR
jgi:uncharacterized protein (TIGR01244 family)